MSNRVPHPEREIEDSRTLSPQPLSHWERGAGLRVIDLWAMTDCYCQRHPSATSEPGEGTPHPNIGKSSPCSRAHCCAIA